LPGSYNGAFNMEYRPAKNEFGDDGPLANQNRVSPIDESGVRGFLHHPEKSSGDGLVLTHGAGASCQSPLLVAIASEFCAWGLAVLRIDLPFRQARPHGPPLRGSAEKDQQGLLKAVTLLKQSVTGRVFGGGHSYGGRQATMLAASRPDVIGGLLLLSYPLHPPQSPAQLRTAHFPNLRTPALFVHGTRDGFGSIAEMRSALELIPARTRLMPIEGAGHELLSKRNQGVLPASIVQAFAEMFSDGG
jgi:predicted alpha/beta-hydrolase family hydrolase